MPKQKFWDSRKTNHRNDRPAKAKRRKTNRDPNHERRVRDSITTPILTRVNPAGDPIAAMTERGRTYVRLLIKSGMDGDSALISMAHVIVKALDEPKVTVAGITVLDGIETITGQLDAMGVNRRDPIMRAAIGRAFVIGGMREVERLGI